MQIKKKHQSGAARNFITRTQAIKKLQISLADFRRLCIFKGIYPREPRNKKKANKGSTAPTTFYYVKDIQYLLHEPVLAKFREQKTFAKKLTRALGKGEVGDAKRLDDNRPKYKLDHIIKERYPSFLEALRDLDDALCMLFLFASMPATDQISQKITETCEKLCNQWMAYIAREHLLKKVFISIKGIYYQAEIKGQEILWLIPFKFPQNIPTDVDLRIMMTFLEFYITLLRFVLFKLYSDSNLVYPPKIDNKVFNTAGGFMNYVLESRNDNSNLINSLPEKALPASSDDDRIKSLPNKIAEISNALDKDEEPKGNDSLNDENNDQDDINNDNNDEDKLDVFKVVESKSGSIVDELPQPDANSEFDNLSNLFADFTFFIGRETPLDVLEFVILSCGGKCISEAALDEALVKYKEDDEDDDNVMDEDSDDDEVILKNIEKSRLKEEKVIAQLLAKYKNKDEPEPKITHQICDRPVIRNKVPGRVYVQPQWIFDSVNNGKLLPVFDFLPGKVLPPHLSPWGDSGTYNPQVPSNKSEEEQAVDEEEEEEEDDEVKEIDVKEHSEDDIDSDEDPEKHQKEIEAELKGVPYSVSKDKDTKKKKRKLPAEKKDEDSEAKELAKIMMSNKQKKLYNKMQYGIKKKETRSADLERKRRRLNKDKIKK